MTLPVIVVEAALDTKPTEGPVNWTDLTTTVEAFSSKRGRSTERDAMQAGQATIRLDNRDRRYDPSYAGSILNLIANPSVETNRTGYNDFNSTSTRDSGKAKRGTYGHKHVRSAAGANGGPFFDGRSTAAYPITVTPGRAYTFSLDAALDVAGSQGFLVRIEWYTAANVVISAAIASVTITTTDFSQRVSVTGTAPATAAYTVLTFYWASDPGAGFTFWTDGWQFEQASSATAYCDGSQDNGRWAGTAHASQSYRGGPYYGNLKRRRRVRVRATWNGQTFPVFAGYVDRWPQAFENWGNAYVDLPLSDGLAVFGLYQLSATYPEERSDQRVARVLDAVAWTTGRGWVLGDATYGLLGSTTLLNPVGARSLSAGQSDVEASTLSQQGALQHLQDVEATEQGLLFISADGSVVFQNRRQRINPFSLAVFGDAPDAGELPYADIGISDDTPIYNDITVTRDGGTAQTAADAGSQADYFPQSLSLSTLHTTDAEALSAANWLLNRYKQPASPRITSLSLDATGDPDTLWPLLLGTELGACLTARRRPPGDPDSVIEQASFLEGIEHSYDASQGVWRVGWSLSPADTQQYWILGDPTYSILGGTSRLSY